jgi:hypothetical protein
VALPPSRKTRALLAFLALALVRFCPADAIYYPLTGETAVDQTCEIRLQALNYRDFVMF